MLIMNLHESTLVFTSNSPKFSVPKLSMIQSWQKELWKEKKDYLPRNDTIKEEFSSTTQ